MRLRTLVLALPLVLTAVATAQAEDSPSVLFVPELHKVSPCAIDLTYLNELHQRGFAVDFLDSTSHFTWERIRQYTSLVIYDVPYPEGHPEARAPGPYRHEFIELLGRYIEAGGGVLLFKPNYRADDNIRPLLEEWDARIPYEVLRQDVNHVQFPRMNLSTVDLAWTDAIDPGTPVSDGVRRIYYPMMDHYHGSETSAIWVGDDWQVVYRAPAEAVSVPFVGPGFYFPHPEDPLVRDPSVKGPPLFALRALGKGRIAFTSTWPTWSIGSGTTWLYSRDILTRGWDGVPSDFQLLLDNTYRWLSAPAVAGDAIGGYQQDPRRVLPPNLQQEVADEFAEVIPDLASVVEEAESRRVVRGLYGAKSAFGGGSGSVEEWAATARALGLGFVVFMDDFAELTPERFHQLQLECKLHSSADLSLIPGYAMETTIGDHFFAYGPGDALTFPPDNCLAGPQRTLFNMQFQTPEGEFIKGNAALNWILQAKNANMNFGYYGFNVGSGTMRMFDMRAYSVAAVRTYENGHLLEDVTDDFLTTVDATIAPLPVTVNIVRSPEELAAQAGMGITQTYGLARGADTVFEDAIQYAHQYSGSPVFSSDGPIVRSWMKCFRPATYASARFVPGRTFAPAFLWVTSDVGLKRITLYDGPRVFRRFEFDGDREVRRTLQLSSSLHRNIVLIAEDIVGGKAVTFPVRVYKPNTSAAFCSDHVNDCGNTYLGRGIGLTHMSRTPTTDGGLSWDGGPQGKVSLFRNNLINPSVTSNLGVEGDRPFANEPHLVFADEAGNGYHSSRTRVYDPRVPAINPWYTYGPLLDSELIDVDVRYGEWHRASVRAYDSGWPAHVIRTGALPSLFELDITSKQGQSIESLQLITTGARTDPQPLMLLSSRRGIVGAAGQKQTQSQIFPAGEESMAEHIVGMGDWFGLVSPQRSNGIMWYNRGSPLRFEIDYGDSGASQVMSLNQVIDDSDAAAVDFAEGERLHYELFSLVYPIDVDGQDFERFKKTVDYFRELPGVSLQEGTRVGDGGPIDIRAEDYRVHIEAKQPSWDLAMALPLRISGLNRNWSAGYYQMTGYAQGFYGDGNHRYHPSGFDEQGRIRATLYHTMAPRTEAIIGHPVVCDAEGLIIQVTQKPVAGGGFSYYVAVNNPTDKTIHTRLQQNIPLPDLKLEPTDLTVSPGAYVVVSE
jgi:hypothetical protein